MATDPKFDKGIDSVSAVAAIIGNVKVGKNVHRLVMLASAAAVAVSTYIGANAVLLGMSPDTVAYVSSAVAAVTTVARIFVPAD